MESATGIVLWRRDSKEFDASLAVLTPNFGKIDLYVKGGKKPTSKLRSITEPLSMAKFTFSPGRARRFVNQVQPERSFPLLRRDYDRLTIALCLAELTSAVLPFEEPSPETFEAVVEFFQILESHAKPAVALLWCELKLMQLAGFAPQFESCCLTGCRVKENLPYVSPSAGGYVCQEHINDFTDRIQTREEVLYGLSAMSQIEQPSANFKNLEVTLRLLQPFWQQYADSKLPARLQLIDQILFPSGLNPS